MRAVRRWEKEIYQQRINQKLPGINSRLSEINIVQNN